MTKNEFMTRLMNELHRRNVADAAEVAEEYEQHFAFKLADGYSEEEIAAKLGAPEELAAQFGDVPQADTGNSAALTWLWLGRPVFRRLYGAAAGVRRRAGLSAL